MPELPEVECVRRGLSMAIRGATIERVTLRRKDLRIAFPPGLAETLAGKTIRDIRRRAKYLLFYVDSDDVAIVHLGMSGRFLIEAAPPKSYDKHDHMILHLADGRVAIFNDTRRFGLVTLTTEKDLTSHALFAHLGPEPLESSFSADYLEQALAKRKGPIKPVLMDQQLVVGVGNIYASEALHLAEIDPRKPARRVASKSETIIGAIRKVLGDAIESGGSSLKDFVHITGKSGYFQHRFQVYDREGEPCRSCRAPIRTIRQAGRSTYFCARCQK